MNINPLIVKLLDTELSLLWNSVNKKLTPIEKDFRNRINAFFSKQQKEIIQNIKKGNYDDLIDYSRYVDKFIDLYIDNVKKITNTAQKRAERESGEKVSDDFRSKLINQYVYTNIQSTAIIITNTTIKKINSFIKDYKLNKISLNELIDNVNDYFNNVAKKQRSKLISITETYRVFNYMYMNFMTEKGYLYKIYVARPNTTCSICSKLHKQKKFVLSKFDTSEIDRNDLNLIEYSLHPPIHPQSKAILLMVKE